MVYAAAVSVVTSSSETELTGNYKYDFGTEKVNGLNYKPSYGNRDVLSEFVVVSKLFNEHKSLISEMAKDISDLKDTIHEKDEFINSMSDKIKSLEETVMKQHKFMEDQSQEIKELKETADDRGHRITKVESRVKSLEQTENKCLVKAYSEYIMENKTRKHRLFSKTLKQNKSETVADWKFNDELKEANRTRMYFDKNIPKHEIKPNETGSVEETMSSVTGMLQKQDSTLERRLLLTQSIAFSAYLNSPISQTTAGYVVKCNGILLNDGNAYNGRTGILTVPKAGVYLLTYTIANAVQNSRTHIRLVVDGREIADAVVSPQGDERMGGNTAIVRLNQHESVWLEAFYSQSGHNGGLSSYNNFRHVTFSGVLLYS